MRIGRLMQFALLAVLAGCGSTTATTTTSAVTTGTHTTPVSNPRNVTVHETEFHIDPANVNAGSEGLVRVKIFNDGKLPHALDVKGPNGLVEFDGQIDPGHTGVLEVDLDKPGTYTMYCPFDSHRAKGMVGTITVGGTQPASAPDTQTTRTVVTGTQTTPTQTQTQTQTQTNTQTKTVTRTQTTTTSTSGTSTSRGY